ncbi:hypothetical protein C8R44DRAFT_736189 [Mycena epipterygia]|nr:hypothetical protein C8R44DRAFT_736189 [Mycena epipterygia]
MWHTVSGRRRGSLRRVSPGGWELFRACVSAHEFLYPSAPPVSSPVSPPPSVFRAYLSRFSADVPGMLLDLGPVLNSESWGSSEQPDFIRVQPAKPTRVGGSGHMLGLDFDNALRIRILSRPHHSAQPSHHARSPSVAPAVRGPKKVLLRHGWALTSGAYFRVFSGGGPVMRARTATLAYVGPGVPGSHGHCNPPALDALIAFDIDVRTEVLGWALAAHCSNAEITIKDLPLETAVQPVICNARRRTLEMYDLSTYGLYGLEELTRRHEVLADDHRTRLATPVSYAPVGFSLCKRARRCKRDVEVLCRELGVAGALVDSPIRQSMRVTEKRHPGPVSGSMQF